MGDPNAERDVIPKLPFELQPGEQVLRFCRRHRVYLYPPLALRLLLAVAPAIAVAFIAGQTVGIGEPLGLALLGIAGLWAAYWLVRAYLGWYRYRHDIWVVTDQRVVDSIRRHWFHHRMASADLVDIEDMSVMREGVLQTVFNFGDVRCQTAGEVPNFVLAGIPRPSSILGIVDFARDAARRSLARPPGV